MKITSNIQYEFVKDVIVFLNHLKRLAGAGVITKFVIGEVWRRQVTQSWLLEKGWTKAKHSNHQDKIAIDIFFWIDGKFVYNKKANKKILQGIGDFWEGLNSDKNRWGGNFMINGKLWVDLPHFERMP